MEENFIEKNNNVKRKICGECNRSIKVCICSNLQSFTPIAITSKILILQHPKEAKKINTSTVSLVKYILKDSVSVYIGDGCEFEKEGFCQEFDSWLKQADDEKKEDEISSTLLLSPGPGAISIRDIPKKHSGYKIIVLDGTWNTTKSLIKNNNRLTSRVDNKRIQRIYLDFELGKYEFRKEPQPHCLSTCEAVAYTLRYLEINETIGNQVFDQLMTVFLQMVKIQTSFLPENFNNKKKKITQSDRPIISKPGCDRWFLISRHYNTAAGKDCYKDIAAVYCNFQIANDFIYYLNFGIVRGSRYCIQSYKKLKDKDLDITKYEDCSKFQSVLNQIKEIISNIDFLSQ